MDEVKVYNQKGMEVKQAIYYIRVVSDPPQETVVTTRNIIDVNPSRKFGFKVDVDDEGTYDVNIRFNPKRFFGIATEVTSFVSNCRTLKSAFSG